jgi:hypothetical protein
MTTRPLSRMRALARKASLRAGTAVLAAGTAAAFLAAAPASAAHADASKCGITEYYYSSQIEFQIDNCPGDGTAGWAWLWVNNQPVDLGESLAATLVLTFSNGSRSSFTVPGGASGANSYGSAITQAQVCAIITEPEGGGEECSGVYNV